MTFTQMQLDAIEVAIANGRTSVEYDGRKVTYRSLAEMLKVRDLIRQQLGLSAKSPRTRVIVHDKGVTP